MSNILVLGQHTQGLIAAGLLAKSGHHVTCVGFPDDTSYAEFLDGYKTGPVVHLPFAIPSYIVDELGLKSYGFTVPESLKNPFQKLPFYDGLKTLLSMFETMHENRPDYNEKGWRDTWNTFEIGNMLSRYDADIQSLFTKSATLSLVELLKASDVDDATQAEIITLCVLGTKMSPSNKGTAAAILPAMALFERQNSCLLHGSLHVLSSSLRESAMANGVNLITDQKIRKIIMNDNDIDTIILDDEQELSADHYIFDFDPVRLFDEFLDNYSIAPAFKNRVHPSKNKKECVHVKMAVPADINIPQFIAPAVDYIKNARLDMKSDGGSQSPILSIVSTMGQSELSPEGTVALDIIAQYFEPDLNNDDAILQAVKQAMIDNIDGLDDDKIIHTSIHPTATQFGQATFSSAMPLLQLFKVFSGYHAIAYDLPINNALVVGYGMGTANHYHTYDGGERVASVFQSMK